MPPPPPSDRYNASMRFDPSTVFRPGERLMPPLRRPLPTFAAHAARWGKGCGSRQCGGNKRVCLLRGQVGADVLFVGEAPGPSENVLGAPFVGPAGQLLDGIVAEAFADVPFRCNVCRGPVNYDLAGERVCPNHPGAGDPGPLRLAFTNVVSCLPLDAGGHKFTEPEYEQLACCAPRFREVVELVRPRLVVAVGLTAAKWLGTKYRDNAWTARPEDAADPPPSGRKPGRRDWTPHPGSKIPRVETTHPAAILRAPEAQADHLYRRNVVLLRDAAEEHLK